MTSTTAAAFSCVGRGRQRSGKNKDDNPELEFRRDVPQSVWTFMLSKKNILAPMAQRLAAGGSAHPA
jgi:hypothetical protein